MSSSRPAGLLLYSRCRDIGGIRPRDRLRIILLYNVVCRHEATPGIFVGNPTQILNFGGRTLSITSQQYQTEVISSHDIVTSIYSGRSLFA